MQSEKLELSQEWDKVFPQSDAVEHEKVTFVNRFGITLAADLYKPKNAAGKLASLAVSGPFGAVKEQASGLYAQTMAERGYLTIAFDPSYTGESGGHPRRVASPDINTEDFSADTRIKATLASTSYIMTGVGTKGYFDSEDSSEQRMQARRAFSAQRTVDYRTGEYLRAGGVVDPLPEDAPQFVKDYHDYYKTSRGYHERSGNSTDGWNLTSNIPWANTNLLQFAHEIESAVMVLHGEKAHSRYMGERIFEKLKGDNKELLIVEGASHCDLYDGGDNGAIPWDAITAFFDKNLE